MLSRSRLLLSCYQTQINPIIFLGLVQIVLITFGTNDYHLNTTYTRILLGISDHVFPLWLCVYEVVALNPAATSGSQVHFV